MRLIPVRSEHVETVWPFIETYIHAACERGPDGGRARDLFDACVSGRNQLWVADDNGAFVAAVVTGIWTEQDGGKVCMWNAVGGLDMSAWHHFSEPIEQWARDHGCCAMRSFSRPGMKRRLEAKGYHVKGYILEKAI